MTTPPPTPVGAVLGRVAADSLVGGTWTLVSRVSGLVRVVVVAAVLGPTQFANLYQASNTLPNLAFELLVGALFTSLVVPALVRHLDSGDTAAAARLAGGFLGLSIAAAVAVVGLVVAAGPLVLAGLTAGAPDGVGGTALGPAWLLLGLLLLQVPLYLVAGMAAAVQNARGRFALAAGAPAVENVGIVLVMGIYALVVGAPSADGQGYASVALLGAGTTGAVLLHAALQWAGARRCGVALLPQRDAWRDPEVRKLVRLAVPSLGYGSLGVVRYLCILVVAAAVPGGVVAFTIAYAFYNLPVALGARPVAQAALPALARAHLRGDDQGYGETFDRAFGLAFLLLLPAALGLVLLSAPLSTAVAFGEMASPEGRELLRFALLGVGLGVVGEGTLLFATQASYARRDGQRPLRAVALRTALTVAGSAVSLAYLDGPALLLALGLSVAAADVVAGSLLCRAVRGRLPSGPGRLGGAVVRTIAAGVAMIPAPLLLLAVLPTPRNQAGGAVVVATAGLAGATVYLGLLRALRSPELSGLVPRLRRAGGPAGEADRG